MARTNYDTSHAFTEASRGYGWAGPVVQGQNVGPPRTTFAKPAPMPRRSGMGIQELLTYQMFSDEDDKIDKSCETHFEKNLPCPHGYGVSDQYVLLDSWQKNHSSRLDHGELLFLLYTAGPTADQMIGVSNHLDNIIEIEMYSFTIPIPSDYSYVTAATSSAALPRLVANVGAPAAGIYNVLSSGLVSVEIKEAGHQSISVHNGTRYSFLMRTLVLEDSVQLLNLAHDMFEFTQPIKEFESLSVVLRNPDVELNLPTDVLYNTQAVVSAGGFLEFNAAAHGLNANDMIFISAFNSADQVVNRYVNQVKGLLVGNGPTTDTFRLNPDVDVSHLGVPGTVIANTNVYIQKNRILISLRLRRVIPGLTNYKTL